MYEVPKNAGNHRNVSDVLNILKAMAHTESYLLLKTIALDNDQGDLNKLQITKKQYHTGISHLLRSGLIKRKDDRYSVTAFGKIMYCIQLMIEDASENRSKLDVIDSVENQNVLPQQELVNFIDALLHKKQIKEFLLRGCEPNLSSSN